jgi:hypothetical protein
MTLVRGFTFDGNMHPCKTWFQQDVPTLMQPAAASPPSSIVTVTLHWRICLCTPTHTPTGHLLPLPAGLGFPPQRCRTPAAAGRRHSGASCCMARKADQLPATQRGAATCCHQAVPCGHKRCCGVGCCAVHVCCGVWSAHTDGLGVEAGSVEAPLLAAGASGYGSWCGPCLRVMGVVGFVYVAMPSCWRAVWCRVLLQCCER